MDKEVIPVNPSTLRYSPYSIFSALEWASFRADTPLTLTADEVTRLRSLGDMVDLAEVERIYLSLSRLLSTHVEANQLLFNQRQKFLNLDNHVKVPFIIGIAGSVAVGKSTTARILQELLQRWPSHPKVDLVTTDGFLYPNKILAEQGKMERKGFPDSYDIAALLNFLSSIKSGQAKVHAPLYSHLTYDILPDETMVIDQPDILIVEGINVLQVCPLPKDGKIVPFVSDFFDFSIYIDAQTSLIARWYESRFMRLRETAFQNPQSFFHRYATLSKAQAQAQAQKLWTSINLKNLEENILPTRPRASLILHKGGNHLVENVALRKL